jgi:hypothetical protein
MVVGGMNLPEVPPDDRLQSLAEERGLYFSFVNASAFATRQVPEKVFKEAFEDWGYYGPPEARPPWLSGGGRD